MSDIQSETKNWNIRKGQPAVELSEENFKKEYKIKFYDPRFKVLEKEIDQLTDIAWQNYQDHRKAPITVKAGAEFSDPDYDLSVEWLDTRNRLLAAQKNHGQTKTRVLLISGSPRNEHTCPSEMSKSFRLTERAKAVLESQNIEVDFLDLSRLAAEFGKKILPCKACVSTAMPLCHWPCSCYPNHALGQDGDWMNEIYEKWALAHGIMIVTPVHWYGLPSPLKLMVDRLVCADGGNPDPTSTHGKNPQEAKDLEMNTWNYPKHLAGRAFAVVVHGDTTGIDIVRRNLTDWLRDLELIPAGASSELSRYIGYYEPYATSHDALDKYQDLFTEVEHAAISLSHQIDQIRSGKYIKPDQDLKSPELK